jgi:hypothetical protein
MTDAAQVPTTQTAPLPVDPAAVLAAGAPSAPGSQSPLDILDQILNDAQAKANNAVEEKAEEDQRAAEEARQRQKALDQQKIQEELERLQGIKQTPQYQAMVEQNQEQVSSEQQKKEDMQGYEIAQIGHTKI